MEFMELYPIFVILRSQMGTDNLFHKRQLDLKRRIALRNAKPRILIVCEGEKTETNYFDAFPRTSFMLKIIGKGYNTKSLVELTRREVLEAKRDKLQFFQVWCVFDRDSHKGDFNTAIKMADASGFRVAYSNESFEVWFLLHFEYLHSGIDRKTYNDKLSKYLGIEYKKNIIDMYDRLKSCQQEAIKRAKQLLNEYDSSNPAKNIPSTTVHLLVEELNNLNASTSPLL